MINPTVPLWLLTLLHSTCDALVQMWYLHQCSHTVTYSHALWPSCDAFPHIPNQLNVLWHSNSALFKHFFFYQPCTPTYSSFQVVQPLCHYSQALRHSCDVFSHFAYLIFHFAIVLLCATLNITLLRQCDGLVLYISLHSSHRITPAHAATVQPFPQWILRLHFPFASLDKSFWTLARVLYHYILVSFLLLHVSYVLPFTLPIPSSCLHFISLSHCFTTFPHCITILPPHITTFPCHFTTLSHCFAL